MWHLRVRCQVALKYKDRFVYFYLKQKFLIFRDRAVLPAAERTGRKYPSCGSSAKEIDTRFLGFTAANHRSCVFYNTGEGGICSRFVHVYVSLLVVDVDY